MEEPYFNGPFQGHPPKNNVGRAEPTNQTNFKQQGEFNFNGPFQGHPTQNNLWSQKTSTSGDPDTERFLAPSNQHVGTVKDLTSFYDFFGDLNKPIFEERNITRSLQDFDAFVSAKGNFSAQEKFRLLQRWVPDTCKRAIASCINNERPFETAIKRLINEFERSYDEIANSLMTHETSLSKPSSLFYELEDAGCGRFTMEQLIAIWTDRLQPDMRSHVRKERSLDSKLQAADALYTPPQPAAPLSFARQSANENDTPKTSKYAYKESTPTNSKKYAYKEARAEAAAPRSRTPTRSKRQDRPRSLSKDSARPERRSNSPAPRRKSAPTETKASPKKVETTPDDSDDDAMCWFHATYGKKARNCRLPCKWDELVKAGKDPENYDTSE